MIDAGSFVASVWLFAHLPKLPREPGACRATGRGLKGVRDDVVDGLRYVFGHTVIRALTIGFWLIVFGTGADDLVLPFLGRDTLHTGAFSDRAPARRSLHRPGRDAVPSSRPTS